MEANGKVENPLEQLASNSADQTSYTCDGNRRPGRPILVPIATHTSVSTLLAPPSNYADDEGIQPRNRFGPGISFYCPRGLSTQILPPPGPRTNVPQLTPMFTSIELSTKSAVEYEFDSLRLKPLIQKLRSIEDDDESLGRAFLDYDGRFMVNFQTVLDQEMEREGEATTSPRVPHIPRHDIESLYWVLLWALSRACPKGCDPDGASLPLGHSQAYNSFVNNLFSHTADDVSARIYYLFGFVGCANLFHPKLANVTELVKDVARYLSVPWHLYDHLMQEDHAHIAVQRLILLHLRDETKHSVFLDPVQPRTASRISRLSGTF